MRPAARTCGASGSTTTAIAMAMTNPMATDDAGELEVLDGLGSRMSSEWSPTHSHHTNESGPLATITRDALADLLDAHHASVSAVVVLDDGDVGERADDAVERAAQRGVGPDHGPERPRTRRRSTRTVELVTPEPAEETLAIADRRTSRRGVRPWRPGPPRRRRRRSATGPSPGTMSSHGHEGEALQTPLVAEEVGHEVRRRRRRGSRPAAPPGRGRRRRP